MAELTGRQNNVGFSYYSDRLQRMRRVLHASLNVQAVERLWGGLIEEHSVGLVQAISTYRSEDGDSISEIVERNVQELIVSLTYGHKPDEEYIRVARGVMTDTMKGLQPSRWMVDIIPALKRVPGWMPGAGFKRWAADARELFNKMTGVPFDGVKAEMARGDAGPSFVMFSLEGLPVNHSKEDEDIVRFSAGSLFSAGSDTTAGVLLTFILLMTLHEAVQDRAHAEITSVLGPWHHLPALSDQPSLPYIDAIVQEVHRFHPAVPLATHSNYAEEEYEGQRVPKKSWILANIWSMVHDEALYPNPDVFDPDRFLSKGGVEPQTDPRTFTFGFGRRRCAGQHLANASLYLYIARMLTLYRLLPELDKDGTASPPPLEFETAFVPTPKPFRCRFVLREGAAEILAHLHPQR
ncbi:cytochrome P450 [Amylostereum chailletii]|nr:cytochrome P450 [Amylostereum chailletii]